MGYIWKENDFINNNAFDEINTEKIIEIFRENGLSCDQNKNPFNAIEINPSDGEIAIEFTTYGLAGEIPNNISEIMEIIKTTLNADFFSFDHQMKVTFYYDDQQ